MERKRGRPPTGNAQSAAERMRAYRRRLREKGLVSRVVLAPDAVTAAVSFAKNSLLTPAEQDVLRRFCSGLRRLPELPLQVALFGSRAKGGSGTHSDLDVAVVMSCGRSGRIERMLVSLAHQAEAPYQEGDAGIHLRPVPVFAEDESRVFFNAIRRDMELLWTRPR